MLFGVYIIVFLRCGLINKKRKYGWSNYKYRHHCARHHIRNLQM